MPSPPVVLELTAAELETRRMESHNLQAAVEALHRDGLVVLKNAVHPDHLDKLNARMVPEAKRLYARPATHRNFGRDTGNIQQEPVLEDGFVFSDVVANSWATDAVQCVLGPRPALRFYSANTAFRATARQPPHVDVPGPGYPLAVPFGFCVNINLVDTSPANGATELWPGTHLLAADADDSGRIPAAALEARRRVSPPIRPSLPKGSLVIRDFRLWHAGMPNTTDDPRVMLVSVLFPHWYRSDLEMRLPQAVQDKIDWGDVVPCVEWMDDGYDYLQGAHDHDFSLKP